MSRPTSSQHRLSIGSNASSLPSRAAYSRSHSHTFSAGSNASAHRINRRKSSTFSPATNPAALAAVEHAVAAGSLPVNRRSSMSKAALASLNDGAPSSLPHHISLPENSSSAIVDGPSLSSFQGVDKTKNRARRASDGTRLTKKEKAASGELKCEHCGKAYKHGSCLNKHLWEHTPEWQLTSKLLISKHQQVQLLEAASVLMDMTAKGTPATDSDNSSSPFASGSSERDVSPSSTETTPPPGSSYRDPKRNSNNSSAYSRSYQSVFSDSTDHPFHTHHHRHWSTSSATRPQTGTTSIADSYRDEDPEDLAAAVGLLKCSSGGTPNQGPLAMESDIPPVPPLPEKYAHVSSQSREVVMDDEEEYVVGRMEFGN